MFKTKLRLTSDFFAYHFHTANYQVIKMICLARVAHFTMMVRESENKEAREGERARGRKRE